ncbi:hypothetical protein [Endozoicomonas euniceicola]|uniref:Uncharacterized protein n=1 Tax=Endozoicomonas euniceicola TaxID=1234143 RepID=A0ABY6H0J6_9GAMM|nr:hypothetical protein [Endozoicomonas euniceicola]UYM18435.1 hypothetical protein NX720_11210 [Endozoicomonas euniceicola]
MFKRGSRSRSQTDNIFSKKNVLQLTNALKFENTTTIPGSRLIPAVTSREYRAKSYFSGYVFRGDARPPDIIFEQGFMLLKPVTEMRQAHLMTGVCSELDESPCYYGYTFKQGISTTVHVYDAAYYTVRRWRPPGYVYLIDAMDMAGFVVYNTMDKFSEPPVLEDIHYEVCFLAPIPNTSIIGFVLPEGHDPLSSVWPEATKRLNLTVNPEYWSDSEKGLTAAKKVVRLFNA